MTRKQFGMEVVLTTNRSCSGTLGTASGRRWKKIMYSGATRNFVMNWVNTVGVMSPGLSKRRAKPVKALPLALIT